MEGSVGQSRLKYFNNRGWIAIQFVTDIHGVQTLNRNDFGEPLTFPLAVPEYRLTELWARL